MEYETAGDPISGLKWTHKTTEKIADELSLEGINICAVTVGRILKNLDYSLKSNSKKISNGGKKLTPEAVEKRNTQFEYIKAMLKKFDTENCPRISSDTKKKELIGNFKNPGTRYKKISDLVNDHDFLTYCIGKAALYGIYDLFNNDGFVVVGQFMKDEKTSSFLSADTPEFAVEAIESWWLTKGIKRYSKNYHPLLCLRHTRKIQINYEWTLRIFPIELAPPCISPLADPGIEPPVFEVAILKMSINHFNRVVRV